jgi:hypothetical protein
VRSNLKKLLTKIGLVEWLKVKDKFEPQYHQKKKKGSTYIQSQITKTGKPEKGKSKCGSYKE